MSKNKEKHILILRPYQIDSDTLKRETILYFHESKMICPPLHKGQYVKYFDPSDGCNVYTHIEKVISKRSIIIVDTVDELNNFSEIHPNYYHDANGSHDLLWHEKQMFSKNDLRGAWKANIFKYVFRYQKKNGVEDLKKAKTYLDRLIQLESENDDKQD